MLALLGPLAPASLDDPIVSDCWRDLSQLQETCNHEKCSNECIGRSDDLFRRWDSCADIHSSISSAFDLSFSTSFPPQHAHFSSGHAKTSAFSPGSGRPSFGTRPAARRCFFFFGRSVCAFFRVAIFAEGRRVLRVDVRGWGLGIGAVRCGDQSG